MIEPNKPEYASIISSFLSLKSYSFLPVICLSVAPNKLAFSKATLTCEIDMINIFAGLLYKRIIITIPKKWQRKIFNHSSPGVYKWSFHLQWRKKSDTLTCSGDDWCHPLLPGENSLGIPMTSLGSEVGWSTQMTQKNKKQNGCRPFHRIFNIQKNRIISIKSWVKKNMAWALIWILFHSSFFCSLLFFFLLWK